MKRWALALGVLMFACGGNNQGAESPDDYDDDYVEDPAEEGDVDIGDDLGSQDDSARADRSDGDTGGGNGAATTDDLKAALQLVLDDEELGPYLKLEEPGRFPLQVSGDLPSGVELVKNTKPVKVVTGPKDANDPVLVFISIDVGPSSGAVKYRYDVERVRGSAFLKKVEGRWELTRSRISVRPTLEEE
jgi:hypothetical protein